MCFLLLSLASDAFFVWFNPNLDEITNRISVSRKNVISEVLLSHWCLLTPPLQIIFQHYWLRAIEPRTYIIFKYPPSCHITSRIVMWINRFTSVMRLLQIIEGDIQGLLTYLYTLNTRNYLFTFITTGLELFFVAI